MRIMPEQVGTFSYLNGNNRPTITSSDYILFQRYLTLKFSYFVIVNVYTEKLQFHYSVAYSAPVECKNWGIIGNLERSIGSFLLNRIIGKDSSIIYQGLYKEYFDPSFCCCFPFTRIRGSEIAIQ